jgi:hypothetical protein
MVIMYQIKWVGSLVLKLCIIIWLLDKKMYEDKLSCLKLMIIMKMKILQG